MNQEKYVIEVPKSRRIYMNDIRTWFTKEVITRSAGQDMITLEGVYPAIIIKMSRDTNIFVHDVNGGLIEIPTMSSENTINEILLKALEKKSADEPEMPVADVEEASIDAPDSNDTENLLWKRNDQPISIPSCPQPVNVDLTEDDCVFNDGEAVDDIELSANDSTDDAQQTITIDAVKPVPRNNNNNRNRGRK